MFPKTQIYDNGWVALGLPAFFKIISRFVVKKKVIFLLRDKVKLTNFEPESKVCFPHLLGRKDSSIYNLMNMPKNEADSSESAFLLANT